MCSVGRQQLPFVFFPLRGALKFHLWHMMHEALKNVLVMLTCTQRDDGQTRAIHGGVASFVGLEDTVLYKRCVRWIETSGLVSSFTMIDETNLSSMVVS